MQNNVLKSLKKALLAKVSQCVLRTLTEESGDQFAQTLVSLVQLSTDITNIRELMSNLPTALQKVDSFER